MLPLVLTSSAFAQSTQSITNPASVVSIFLSLLVVVAIIFALAYVMRRLNVTTMGNGQMKVVASMVAGAKEKIMVIEVGDEQHLVGVTAHTITHLSKLDAKLETPQRESKPGGELFKQKLVAAMAGKINPAIKENKHDA